MYSQELNYAKRLLKLANTNIWLEKFQEASLLVEQAKQIISRFNTWEARYWDAVADETLGRVYLQMGNYDFAEMHFKKALDKFDKLLDSNFEGSQVAMKTLIEQTKVEKEKTKEKLKFESQGKNVNLSYRAISGYLNLPVDLVGFTAVESNLNQFPSELYGKKELKKVVLRGNRISEATIKDMPALEYLDLSENNLTNLKIDYATVPNLKYLILSNNRFKKLPQEILSLKKLEVIDLTNNSIQFSDISNLIQNLPNTLIIFDQYELIEEEEE